MKKITTFIIIVLGMLATQAQNIQYTLLSSNNNEAVVRVNFGTYQTETVSVNGVEMQKLHMADAYPVLKAGSPELLQTAFSLIVPEGSSPEVELLDAQYTTVQHFALAPSKGKLYRNVNPASVAYTTNQDYQANRYLLGNNVVPGEEYQLRDYHGMNFKVYPFDYNPAAQTLKIYSSVTVKVTFNGTRTVSAPKKNNRTFDAVYATQFLNYQGLRGTPVTEEGDILIIAPEDFMAAMQPYADWKTRNGFNTEIVSTAATGNNAVEIKSFIQNYYSEHNLAFVIIVGDNAQFPTPTVSGNKSDNYYTELVGNDSYPDIILGKISAENVAQVETQVQRFIQYELNPSDTSHFTSFMGIASNQGPGDNNEYDYQHIRNIDNKLLAYTYTDGYEFFEGNQGGLDASGDPTATMVGNAVNSGVGIITYCGHGGSNLWVTSNFNNNNVNALTNVGKLPFIFSVACVNGEYHTGTCFAEAWLRATHEGEPTGAVGFTGSTINQPWNSPMCAEDAMIDLLIGTVPEDQKFTYGGVFFNGMIHMLDVYNDVEVFRTWILFGDPTLLLRTAAPEELIVSYNDILPVGVPYATFSSAVENAKIVVSKNDEIIGIGRILNGDFTLDFNATYLPTDTLQVLATATNYLPYEGTINFIPNEGPYVIVSNLDLSEQTLPESNTIINGLAEYGETLLVTPEIINIGSAAANNVQVSITTDDPYVTLSNNSFTINTIAANDTLDNQHFTLKVADIVPANHNAVLHLRIIFNNDTVEQNKIIKLYAPLPMILSGNVDDTADGNGNHRIDYGETFSFNITLTNKGNMDALPGTLQIGNPAGEISIPVFLAATPNIEAKGNSTLSFQMTVNDTVSVPTFTYIKAVYTVDGYQDSIYFPVKIGAVVEDWETGDFTNMEWMNSSSIPWTITTQNPYEGTYCAKSGNIADNGTTTLSISYHSDVADSISFYYKVSSEEMYDKLIFRINGAKKDEWSGNIGWTRAVYPINPGSYTFTWVYTKDNYMSAGKDCAYIDDISFPCGRLNSEMGIEDYVQEASWYSVWPNPATETVHIQMDASDNNGSSSYQLFDMSGKLIQGGRLTDNISEIDVRNLVAGTYLLKVENSNHQTQTTKIVKK
jgi:gingipain R